ncbi:MAG: hypothetical protein ACYTFG_16700, partial [Planctomycetota bacterium]
MRALSRALCLLAVILAVAALVPGCKDEKNITVYQQLPGGAGGFPGIPLYQTALASDGKAFGEAGYTVTAVRRFDSGQGETLILFEAVKSSGSEKALFASHFDGTDFTPTVETVGWNQDPADSPRINQAFAAFLFPSEVDFPGNGRSGDAVIGFLRNDLDDGGGNTAVDPNRRLFIS